MPLSERTGQFEMGADLGLANGPGGLQRPDGSNLGFVV